MRLPFDYLDRTTERDGRDYDVRGPRPSFSQLPRQALLRVNNASARETSFLSPEKFDQMIASALVATFIGPQAVFLLAFEQTDDYDGGHFRWFRSLFLQVLIR